MLISVKPAFGRGARRSPCGCGGVFGRACNIFGNGAQVERRGHPQRPSKGPPPNRLLEALLARMEPRAAAREPAPGVGSRLQADPIGSTARCATIGRGVGDDHTQQN